MTFSENCQLHNMAMVKSNGCLLSDDNEPITTRVGEQLVQHRKLDLRGANVNYSFRESESEIGKRK